MPVILALDSSAASASACVLSGGAVRSLMFAGRGAAVSTELMPLADFALRAAGLSCGEADAFAVSAGPGSFTGLRIGVSAVKGLAWACDKPCRPVSTLEAIAYCHLSHEGPLLAAMDARRNQVYAALFMLRGGKVTRLTPDAALAASELGSLVFPYGGRVLVAGDGAAVAYAGLNPGRAVLAPEGDRQQSALGVALCAAQSAVEVTAEALRPAYLRLSQAEREKLRRESEA